MKLILGFLLFLSLPTLAQTSLPLGEREAFMGNIGIARDGTVGNTYHNPAGLAFGKINKLVGSGTLLQTSTAETVGGSTKAKASQTNSLPIGAGTTWVKEDYTWAFSVYNLSNDKVRLNATSTVPVVGAVTGRFQYDQVGLIVGPSYARKVTSNISVGGSAFLYQHEASTMAGFPFQATVGANTVIGSAFSDQVIVARSLKLIAGVLAKYEYFDFGARFESGPLGTQAQMESTGHTISYTKDGANNIVSETTTVNPTTKKNVKFDRPHILGVGIGTLLSPRLRLVSDASMSFAKKYEVTAGTNEEYKSAMRVGAGLEYTGAMNKYLGGFSYIQDNTSDDVFLYTSAGYVSLDKRADTAVGVFFITTLKAEETRQTTIGLLLSSSIKL